MHPHRTYSPYAPQTRRTPSGLTDWLVRGAAQLLDGRHPPRPQRLAQELRAHVRAGHGAEQRHVALAGVPATGAAHPDAARRGRRAHDAARLFPGDVLAQVALSHRAARNHRAGCAGPYSAPLRRGHQRIGHHLRRRLAQSVRHCASGAGSTGYSSHHLRLSGHDRGRAVDVESRSPCQA